MKGDKQVVALLNDVLTGELTAVNQYWLHARLCENWGYERLWKKVRDESLGEMKHADELIDRILYLDGMPNLQRYGKISVGQTVPEQFQLDLSLEVEAVKRLNDGIELCRSLGDNGTRELLEHILRNEEEHIDWLEEQQRLLQHVGEQNYLSEQMKKDS
jgi:bacterioferritin